MGFDPDSDPKHPKSLGFSDDVPAKKRTPLWVLEPWAFGK
jgi:hypothetical protein